MPQPTSSTRAPDKRAAGSASIASSARRVEACPPVPKAWPGSITSSRPAKPAGAGTKDGRTRRRGEITSAARPSFQASDQARSGTGSGAPISSPAKRRQRLAHPRRRRGGGVEPERGRRTLALLRPERARREGLGRRALAQLRRAAWRARSARSPSSPPAGPLASLQSRAAPASSGAWRLPKLALGEKE